MLNNLHTHRTSCGVGMFRTGFRMPENAVLAGILAQLPTKPNGFFTSVRFVSPIPGTLQRDLADTFALTYTAREDSYVVDTRTQDVTVASDNLRGLIYGAYALLQQVQDTPDAGITKGLIYNLPRCPFRGLKVYLPAPDDLDSFYRTVDLLCALRYNTLIVEVGGAMEYKKHPEINSAWIDYCKEMGKYPDRANEVQNKTFPWAKNSIHFENGGGQWLTQDTVRELLAYCRARGMEVIPECPTLSHADYLLMPHRELAERADDYFPDVYCPSNPATYDLVFDVLTEVLDVFWPKIVHIGHDEYYSIGICDRCKGKTGEELFAGDVIKIYDWLKARGVRTMFWADKMLNAIDSNGAHHGGSERRVRHPDGTVEIVRPATWKCADMLPKDIIAHHWYWSLCEYFDVEYLSRGIEMWYGNFSPVGFLDWNRRLAAGAKGGAPSHWSSLEDDTLQRNGVFLSLFYGTLLFWDEHYDDAKYPEYIERVFDEMFLHHSRETLKKPHFDILHATSVERPYVYISSLPMQLQKDTIGKYVVTYDDGTTFEIPVVYGLNVTNLHRDWTRVYQGDMDGNRTLAERDTYKTDPLLMEVAYTARPIRVGEDTYCRIVVENPYPEKHVTGVETVKTAGDPGEIILGRFMQREASL